MLDLKDISCNNEVMYIIAAFLFFSLAFPFDGTAAEKGYDEAVEYFIHRKKIIDRGHSPVQRTKKQKQTPPVKASAAAVAKNRRFFVGLGVSKLFSLDSYSLEAGLSLLNTKYVQQSLALEYLSIDTVSSLDFESGLISNKRAHGAFLFHNVQLSSDLFFLSPELSVGGGRIFNNPRKGGLLSFKAGLVYSTKWSRKFLFSGHLYYRRNQYFSKKHHGDGVGLSLRFGF